MSSGSPTAYLLWSILSCIFLALLVIHLWLYDRFACLRWDSGRQPGAFKRVMTYSYMGTLPTLICFSIAMTALKFREGWVVLPKGQIIPQPFDHWEPQHRRWLLPLFFMLSISWSLELVTHLEELAFWLFLLHQGPGKRDWFHCWEFRAWYFGSFAAVLGMPLTTLVTRHHLDSTIGWIFLVGSLAGTTTTVCFLYVIFRFPRFLDYVKAGGADPDVIVRLATFYQLNCIRIVFRFFFSLPLLIIGLDAIKGPYPVVSNSFAIDFLLMVAGMGSFISSGITLLVFFPRSITHETGYQVKIISPQSSTTPPELGGDARYYHNHHQHHIRDPSNPISALDNPASPASTARMHSYQFPRAFQDLRHLDHPLDTPRRSTDTADISIVSGDSDRESLAMTSKDARMPLPHPIQHSQSQPGHTRMESLTGNSGTRSDDTMWEEGEAVESLDSTLRRHSDGPFIYNRHGKIARSTSERPRVGTTQVRPERPESQLHPYLLHFTSPIDLMDGPLYDERPGNV